MTRRLRLTGRPPWIALAATLACLATGCSTPHELTRPPDPPLNITQQGAVVLAVLLAGGVSVALLIRISGGRRNARRLLAAWVYFGLAVVGIGSLLIFVATVVRIDQLAGGFGNCMEIPFEQRPETIMQIACSDGDGVVLLLLPFVVVLFGLFSVVAGVLAVICLRGDRTLWVPFAVAVAVAITAGVGVIRPGEGTNPRSALPTAILALATAGGVAAALGAELTHGRERRREGDVASR